MRMSRDGEPGVSIVIAAQGGDEQALDSLLAEYLPLVYNIVGRALNGHADVDDVVQDTMLRVVRGIGDLRDPAAFRSWLVAVAIRQLQDHRRAQQAAPARDLRPEVADAGGDFADLTILRLGLSGQRRETAQAGRWLDASDQELLALWWLEAGGELERAEIAAALGVAPRHAAVRIARMKEQLTTARIVVRAMAAEPRCAGLADAAAGWDQVPGPLWRKRLARHARDCEQCGAHGDGLIPAERLLGGLPLLPVAAAAGSGVMPGSHQAVRRPAVRRPAARRAVPRLRHARLLSRAAGSGSAKIAAISAASVVAVGAAVGAYAAVQPPAARPAADVRAAATLGPVTADIARPEPAPAARRAAAPAANAKKGVSAWTFSGVTRALRESGASWYYTWSSNHAGITSPRGVHFVPMIWGPGSVNAATLRQARRYGHILLGFNEPDMASQSNMSVPQALRLWPQLMATGMQLGSPAVADDAATPGGWLDRFMRGAKNRGYRVNFITVHWYGADFATGPAVSQLKAYLQAIHARYRLPIWLTEFALIHFGGTESFPTWRQQAAFVTASTSMLQHLSYVHRYAWFALPSNSSDGTTGLFRSGPAVTTTGRAFEAAGRSH